MNIIHRSESIFVSRWRLYNAITLVLWGVTAHTSINISLRVADHVATDVSLESAVALESWLDGDGILETLHVGVIERCTRALDATAD